MPTWRLVKGNLHDRFRLSRKKVQILGGGFGNGKTTSAVMKAIELARAYPGSNGLIARATYPKLNDTIRKAFMQWCPPSWIKRRPTQDDNTAYMTNGTAVNFRYVAQRGKLREDGSTASNLLSASYDWIIVDQVEDPEITHKDFLDLLGRLRGDTPYRPMDGEEDDTMPVSGPRWLILTSNPSRGWFFHEVVKPVQDFVTHKRRSEKLIVDEETGEPLIDLIEGSTYENKHNLPKDYIAGLEASYKGQMRSRYLLGLWEAFEGLVHPEYDAGRHLITRQQALDHLAACRKSHVQLIVHEGYDFGNVSPSCYMLGVADDWGRIIILDGFYRGDFFYDMQPDAVAGIRLRYSNWLRFDDRINADPAIFRKVVVAGAKTRSDTIAKLLKDLGMDTRPASNDVMPGIAKINSYLNGHPFVPHIITEDIPGPLLYFVDDLTFIQDEISSYYWKKNPQGEYIDEPIDRNDHAMNTLKYLLSRAPQAANVVIPKKHLSQPWMMWREQELEAR